MDFSFDEYEVSFPITFDKPILVDIRMVTLPCFLVPFAQKAFFPVFYTEVVCVFVIEVCF